MEIIYKEKYAIIDAVYVRYGFPTNNVNQKIPFEVCVSILGDVYRTRILIFLCVPFLDVFNSYI